MPGDDHSFDIGEVTYPAATLRAEVVTGDMPEVVPDDLVAFVVAGDAGWELTSDAVAFGEPDVIARFARWRSEWIRSWDCGDVTNVTRLVSFARAEQLDDHAGLLGTLERAGAGATVKIPAVGVTECRAVLGRIADAVRARDAVGYGLVDATPGRERRGLARSWPSWGDETVVSGARGVTVRLRPDLGLVLELADGKKMRVGDVKMHGGGVSVSSESGDVTLDGDHAVALSWLMPGAAMWRQVEVPEVVAWAKLLAGLDDCFEFASDAQRLVTLTSVAPVTPVS